MIREFSTLADETALVAHYRELGFGNRLIAEATGIRRSRVCYLQRKLGYSSKVFPPELRGFRPFPLPPRLAREHVAHPGAGSPADYPGTDR